MEPKLMARITRIEKRDISRTTKKGKRYSGPYWYGVSRENGKETTVYIGKELPKELERLIKKRYKKPGYQNYTWPRPRAAVG